MVIRRKSLIVVSLTVVCLIAVIFLSSRLIVLSGFARLDEEFARKRIKVALSELHEKIENLDAKLLGWVIWDDAYTFVNNGNEDFIKSNLTEQAFLAFKINYIIFIDSSGNIVWGKGFDLEKNKPLPLSQNLEKLLVKESSFTRHTNIDSVLTGL